MLNFGVPIAENFGQLPIAGQPWRDRFDYLPARTAKHRLDGGFRRGKFFAQQPGDSIFGVGRVTAGENVDEHRAALRIAVN